MDIDYRCEHCGKRIRAPGDSAGRTGACPHCGGSTYVPRAMDDDEGEIPLVPLDEEEERRQQQAAMEDAALQRSLLNDRAAAEKKGLRRRASAASGRSAPAAAPGSAPSVPALSAKEVNLSVVSYIEAMSQGQLPEADAIAAKLAKHRTQVMTTLESLATDDLAAYGLPALPRPVLLGFLKQLRSRL